MRSKILTGAAAFTLAAAAGVMTSAPASAGGALTTAPLPFWATGYYGYYEGYYPGYVYPPGYIYAPNYAQTSGYSYAPPLYGYYGAYDWGPWSYRGGPHPR